MPQSLPPHASDPDVALRCLFFRSPDGGACCANAGFDCHIHMHLPILPLGHGSFEQLKMALCEIVRLVAARTYPHQQS